MKWLMTILIAVGLAAAIVAGTALSSRVSGPGDPGSPGQMAPGATITHDAIVADGSDNWEMGTYTDTSGNRCTQQNVPGEGQSTQCLPPAQLFTQGHQMYVRIGARQQTATYAKTAWDNVWVTGYVTPTVKTIRLVTLDCSTQNIPVDSVGAFLYVIGKAQIARGILPYTLLALDNAGNVVDRQSVSVPLPRNAISAGMKPPTPAAACA
jgi:hypothetical protein